MSVNRDPLQLARPEILALKAYQSAREEFVGGTREMILLDANENPYPSAVNRYPDPMQRELKQKLGKFKQCSPDQIFLGNGSDEVLHLLMQIFCVPGKDKAVILPPTFGMYQVCADIHGVEIIAVPLTARFQLDLPAIEATYAQQPKMIFIPSPNNPSGNCFPQEELLTIIENFPGIVVLDEAYVEFTANASLLNRLDEFPHLIIVQTFSKAQGMAGVRLGMCYAHTSIITLLNKLKAPYNLNVLTQEAVMRQLDRQDEVRREVAEMLAEKNRIIAALEGLAVVEEIFPSDTNFFLLRVADSERTYHQLLEEGIVVRNPSKQVHCQNTLRISVGTPQENDALLAAFSKFNRS